MPASFRTPSRCWTPAPVPRAPLTSVSARAWIHGASLSITIHHYQSLSIITINHHYQSLSPTINHYQPPSITINHYQSLSVIGGDSSGSIATHTCWYGAPWIQARAHLHILTLPSRARPAGPHRSDIPLNISSVSHVMFLTLKSELK